METNTTTEETTMTAPNATIRYRYEISDAHHFDLNDAARTFSNALVLASEYSFRRCHSIIVYDRMAKVGKPCEWAVQPGGSAIVVRYRKPNIKVEAAR